MSTDKIQPVIFDTMSDTGIRSIRKKSFRLASLYNIATSGIHHLIIKDKLYASPTINPYLKPTGIAPLDIGLVNTVSKSGVKYGINWLMGGKAKSGADGKTKEPKSFVGIIKQQGMIEAGTKAIQYTMGKPY